MDGETLQARVYKGQRQLARHIGLQYRQYRIGWLLFDPLSDDSRHIGDVYAAYSKTRLFHQPPDYRDATELLWADGRDLLPRDVLTREDETGASETFFIAWMPINLPIEAVRCNTTLRIDRKIGNTSQTEPIASGIPACMLNTRLQMEPVQGASGVKQPMSHWRVQIPLEEGTVRQYDVLTDQNGVRYSVNVPDYQRIGYVIEASLIL